MKNNLLGWGFTLAAGAPLLALAQVASTPPPKHSPQLSYHSVFADYKPWEDARPGNWRALNDAVGKSADHADSMPMGGASAPASAASKPTMADHSGHQMQMPGGKK